MELEPATVATYEKYRMMEKYVAGLDLKSTRDICRILQVSNQHLLQETHRKLSPDVLLPRFGITAGEYAVWKMLTDPQYASKKKPTVAAVASSATGAK